jgi:hypothetical protein
MRQDQLEAAATSAQLGEAVKKYRDELERLHHAHGGDSETVRHVTYRGHDIRIVTTYRIELDGEPITGHLMVNNAGSVHYHAIPNQEFPSAIDAVKRIVDLTDDPDVVPEPDPHHHGGSA